MASVASVALEALALRDCAWRLYTAGADDPGERATATLRRTTASGIQVFLTADRCALSLRQILTARGLIAALPPDARAALDRRAMGERLRVIAARKQLAFIGAVGEAGGWQTIVLKAGSLAARDRLPLDLIDVDVLVPPDRAAQLADALDQAGYVPRAGSSARHLAPRQPPNGIRVDIHVALALEGDGVAPDIWTDAVRVAEIPGLWRLAPPDHVSHVLTHVVTEHPNRRASIRDMLLLSEALRDCSHTELQELENHIATRPEATVLSTVVAQARAVGTGPAMPDSFRIVALASYQLVRRPWWLTEDAFALFRRWVYALVMTSQERRGIWAEIRRRTLGPSGKSWIAAVERAIPPLGRVWRMGVRTALRVATLAVAVPVALAVKHAASVQRD